MDINALKAQIETDAGQIDSAVALENMRLKYLGRKGVLAELTAAIPSMPPEQRAVFGKEVNAVKGRLLELFSGKEQQLSRTPQGAVYPEIDRSMPGIAQEIGGLHVLTQTIDEITTIFNRMGFLVEEGPEVETEYNNFTGLNIPLDHPSRDAFDTFYLKAPLGDTDCQPANAHTRKLLLRSHTSPVQVRVMKARKPPLAVVVPGRVYRPDAVDASHSFMFHQVEGFMVDTNITFAHLKGVLEVFAKTIFGKDIRMRFRPHFFPFTEPSAEVDISCIICAGSGCSVCGRKGWLEILGAGMIHPNVFQHVGYDQKRYSGFAFGMGVERIAMLKHGINDIRLFFENDLRFLGQF